jgi:probable F420-dependent oxidoreductase
VLVDLSLDASSADPGASAEAAEEEGFDGIWTAETGHDPYLPLLPAALSTRRITLGTAIAVAFPRSPMVHAQIAWDLQRASGGRFVLGLGPQVRAHNERRYGVAGDRPAARMREMLQAIRAIWRSFQDGVPLAYRGEFHSLSLLTPFFNPGPLAVGSPPIFLAAVARPMLRVAGAEADGVVVHPLHTERYLDDILVPIVAGAAREAGREASAVPLAIPVMIATGDTDAEVQEGRERMRLQIAFYASTPSYRPVLESEGRGESGDRLHQLSVRGEWGRMAEVVDDALLDAVCTAARWDDLPAALGRRYAGRAARLMPYGPLPIERWADVAGELRRIAAAPPSPAPPPAED